ncbi:MAG: hypothetical protein HYY61_01795 [Deltaproteobacteria bacterium]|nr:hypothetical protein [Deltaproteobacteria bacterium]
MVKKLNVLMIGIGLLLSSSYFVHAQYNIGIGMKTLHASNIKSVSVSYKDVQKNEGEIGIVANTGEYYVISISGSEANQRIFQLAHEIKNCQSIQFTYPRQPASSNVNQVKMFYLTLR